MDKITPGTFFRSAGKGEHERVLASFFQGFMQMKEVRCLLFIGAASLIWFAAPSPSLAQAAAGPLPQAQSQDPQPSRAPTPAPADQTRTKNIAGSWKLNPEESDDARKKMQEARGGGRGSGPAGGRGGMGGGRGGYGGRSRSGQSEEDRARMQELVSPASMITIAQKEPEIDLTDDQDRKRAFFTDGRKLKKPKKDSKYEEFAAKWDEYVLTAEEKGPRGKIQRSFQSAPGGQQLYETLLLTIGRNNTSVNIRYVYDLVPAPAQPAAK